ncbi:uncharacterized protein LOC131002292 [Salvia miltiorrhiza]|uniref:uncharacterized protein LOC131002292 n=1 Tax=Salvia miltiorrhiza TaxID=226208 RepID=UPI0025AD2688|nr:uncharacterized protein LOC131002292 [Salvia miltiorrhiza]XP_057784781.1 uncharacterized protein LOC131002292 [Salvia miltiorrhiza]XP_057784788.1 uncharacterized protein LOC131002292 [Salvia miltiorrhiza]
MEFGSYQNMHDKNHKSSIGRANEPDHRDASENPIPVEQSHPSGPAEVNMEVPITADEVIRAGGFGATDDIGTMLPAASDCTDFEDHLRDVQGYEGSKDAKTGKVEEGVTPEARGAASMEASFFSDDVIRAGGFGATDNISSFLPVASDYTDFEENLRDARGYEESEEKSSRPGLGWKSK